MEALFVNTRYRRKEDILKDINETICFYPGLTTCRFNLGDYLEIGLQGTISLPFPTKQRTWEELDCPFVIRLPSEFPAVPPVVRLKLPSGTQLQETKYIGPIGEIKSNAIKWTPPGNTLQNYITALTNLLSTSSPCSAEDVKSWVSARPGQPHQVPACTAPPAVETRKTKALPDHKQYKEAMTEPAELLADGKIAPNEYVRRLRAAAKTYFKKCIAPTLSDQ